MFFCVIYLGTSGTEHGEEMLITPVGNKKDFVIRYDGTETDNVWNAANRLNAACVWIDRDDASQDALYTYDMSVDGAADPEPNYACWILSHLSGTSWKTQEMFLLSNYGVNYQKIRRRRRM